MLIISSAAFLFLAGLASAEEPQRCSGPHDSSCSPSYACVQFPDLKFYCHPTLKLCPRGLPALVGMDKPIFCQGPSDSRTCPQRTQCLAITSNPSVHICCDPEAETGAGSQGSYQTEYGNGQGFQQPKTQQHSAYGQQTGYEQQTTTPTGQGWCPSDMTPQVTGFGAEPQSCMGPGDTTSCQVGSTCVMSPRVPGKWVCCCRGCNINPVDVCPNKGMPAMVTGKPVECGGCQDHYSCPRGTSCLNSPKSPGKFFCCGAPQREIPVRPRAFSEQPLFEDDDEGMGGREGGFESQYPRGFERPSATEGQRGFDQGRQYGGYRSRQQTAGPFAEQQFGRGQFQQTQQMPYEEMRGQQGYGPYQRRGGFGSEDLFGGARQSGFMHQQPFEAYGGYEPLMGHGQHDWMGQQRQQRFGQYGYGQQPWMQTPRAGAYGSSAFQYQTGQYPQFGGAYGYGRGFTPNANPLFGAY